MTSEERRIAILEDKVRTLESSVELMQELLTNLKEDGKRRRESRASSKGLGTERKADESR